MLEMFLVKGFCTTNAPSPFLILFNTQQCDPNVLAYFINQFSQKKVIALRMPYAINMTTGF